MKSHKLSFNAPIPGGQKPRLGGGAYIGNLITWPRTPEGEELTLIASLPTDFLNSYAACTLPSDFIISVFSYFSSTEYFLDYVTYHGFREELEWLRKGYTRVILHKKDAEMRVLTVIPELEINISQFNSDNESIGGSKIGGVPDLLQAEPLDLGAQRFALQLYGADFPPPYKGIFGLSDAVGYLFVDTNLSDQTETTDAGTFFVQVT